MVSLAPPEEEEEGEDEEGEEGGPDSPQSEEGQEGGRARPRMYFTSFVFPLSFFSLFPILFPSLLLGGLAGVGQGALL